MAAAVGIMFDANRYTAILSEDEQNVINDFFDSFQWDITSGKPIADEVKYGDLLSMVDFNNRWVYQGSVTTPACAQKVFWNQMDTVYPIKQRHVDQFNSQLSREIGPYAPKNLAYYGNNRNIQKIDNHNIHYISNPGDARRRVAEDN
jgi:carbonic anhydrase